MVMVPRAPAASVPAASSIGESSSDERPSSVMAVQRALSRLGYDAGPADGRMGAKTRKAVTAYEKDKGWESSGTVSQRLQDRLVADLKLAESAPATPVVQAKAVATPAITAKTDPASVVRDNADAAPAVSARRSAADAAERRRVAEAQQRGPFETAVVEFFNTMRDLSVFVVRSFSGSDTPPAADVAQSN